MTETTTEKKCPMSYNRETSTGIVHIETCRKDCAWYMEARDMCVVYYEGEKAIPRISRSDI